MSSADLLFGRPPATNGNLVFGEPREGPTPERVDIEVTAALPGPAFAASIGLAYYATVAATLAPPTFEAEAQYRSNTDRPLTATMGASWRQGVPTETGVDEAWLGAAQHLSGGADAGWCRAEHRSAETTAVHREANRNVRQSLAAVHRTAAALHGAPATLVWRNGDRSRRQVVVAPWRNGQALRAATALPWRNGDRSRRRGIEAMHREAQAMPKGYEVRYGGRATPLHRGWDVEWRNAIKPPAGTSPGPEPPEPPHACYTPSGHIVFDRPWLSASTHLLFTCDEVEPPLPPATVIVPVRRIYMTINNVSLRRVEGNVLLPATSLRLNIDTDSWTWTFNATLERAAEEYVARVDGQPVELEASINGTAYRLLAEVPGRDRTFPSTRITVSGRGKNARLAAPWALSQTFSNNTALTAQQLVEDALTLNGVSIGWSVDWGLEDWLVPAGVWTHTGSHMSAALRIAAAAGGYVQPHRTGNVLKIRHRYPVAPWEWGGETPDFEIPAALAVAENIRWVDKPAYDRVFVSGARDGILAQVTRAGAAGDLVAPMVVDDLIVAVQAGRQRGRAILSDTGAQASVDLRLPVITETGVIEPGALVRYLDGTTPRLGMVRSTAIETDFTKVRQTLGLETHVG